MKRKQNIAVLTWIGVVLLLVSSSAAQDKMDLDKDIDLEIIGVSVQNRSYSTISPYWTVSWDDNTKGQQAPMINDLTQDGIYIANSSESSYGIDCNQDKWAIHPQGGSTLCDVGNITVPCVPYSAIMRFKEAKLHDLTVPEINFFVYPSTPLWEQTWGKQGVIGLSPKSEFWNYFQSAFSKQPGQTYVEVSTAYKIKDPSQSVSSSKVQLIDSHFTVNGRFGINEPIVQNLNSRYANWVYEGVTIEYSKSDKRSGVNLCVDNNQNVFFFALDASEIIKALSMKLCGADSGCTKEKSNMKNVDTLRATFSGDDKTFDIEIKPTEFINFDSKGYAIFAIGNLYDSPTCNRMQTMGVVHGVGRLFLTKAEFIVRVPSSGTLQLGFNEITYPDDTLFLIIIITLGVIVLGIIFGIVIAHFCKKEKTATQEGEYTKETN